MDKQIAVLVEAEAALQEHLDTDAIVKQENMDIGEPPLTLQMRGWIEQCIRTLHSEIGASDMELTPKNTEITESKGE